MTTKQQEITKLLQYDPSYTWRGGALSLIRNTSPEVILAGPSETGKTWAACYKAHYNCREWAGTQGALVRKVAASIPGTVVLTMKRIIGEFPVTYYGGIRNPERIIYPNGSCIWIGGMDRPDKVLSGERDFFQVCQAEGLTADDWETMTTRTTGRGAVMPFTQVFGDCNPGGSRHWILERAKVGSLHLFRSVHEDNPVLYDEAGNLTAQGERTFATLDALTGVRHKRLRLGIWATAEGAVYENFDASIHAQVRPFDEFKSWGLAIDEGYTNPAVILLIGIDSDDRWHIMREFYERGKLQSAVVHAAGEFADYVSVSSKEALIASGIEEEEAAEQVLRLTTVAVDAAAAGLIADLANAGLPAQAAKGRVLDGIYAIQNRLKVAGDGQPRLTVDPSCVNTINEFESYIWKPEKDQPVKQNDHAMDALRYFGDAPYRIQLW